LVSGSREWDAGTYDRVSDPQLAWGRSVLGRLLLRGDETVLDAGCGSGRVTELLLDAVPEGEVIGVDGSRAMLDAARDRLGSRPDLIHADLLELELADQLDAVFSTATFHWITDHRLLFARIAAWLRPGGRLEAQCGGEGNVASFFAIVDRVSGRKPYERTLGDLPASRHFAGPEQTSRLLAASGFTDVRCWLEPSPVRPPQPRAYIGSVCLGAHTAVLPESERQPFIDEVYDAWGPDRVLDYVRLNISARKPTAG
jgi:trans-aconitate 2-methyltransferase